MTERELIVPLRQERELQRRVKELEEALCQLEKNNAAMRALLINLGYHAAGCGVFQGGRVEIWPNREAYLSDDKCDCGLKSLLSNSGAPQKETK